MTTKRKRREPIIVDGVDLVKIQKQIMALPSAKHMRLTPRMSVAMSKTKQYTTGRCWGPRLHLTVGYDSTINYTVGVLIHEMAHSAGYYAHEPWGDADREFYKRCNTLHDEWNEKHGDKIRVCSNASGAYRGSVGRKRRRSPNTIKVLKGLPAPAAPKRRVTIDDAFCKTLWLKIPVATEVVIPGVVACELAVRCSETVDETSADWRHRFADRFDRAERRKRGRGFQYAMRCEPGEEFEMFDDLRKALAWAIEDYIGYNEPGVESATARFVQRLANA